MDKLHGDFPPQGALASSTPMLLKDQLKLRGIYDSAKAFDCVDHNKLWKILKEIGIPDHLTYLLRKLYAGQETTVRTGRD